MIFHWRAIYVRALLLGLLLLPAARGSAASAPLTPGPPPPYMESGEARTPGLLVRLCAADELTVDRAGRIRGAAAALAPVLARWGLVRGEELLPGSGLYRLNGGAGLDVAGALADLGRVGVVLYAEADAPLRALRVPNDPQYAARQYALPRIGAPAAWDVTTGNPGLVVADLDTGIAAAHPDLAGKVVAGYDFVNDDADPNDDDSHGTYTAGIMAANTNNGVGVAGVCWGCRIMAVKILNNEGEGVTSDFTSGVRWATDHGARVINISAGVERSSRAMLDALNYALDRNVVIVASAGNTPDGTPRWPAAYERVIAVSATDENDQYADFSSYGDYVDIAAPGVNILSTAVFDGRLTYAWADGTSAAAPFVAGAAALLLSVNPDLTPQQVKGILQDSADDLGPPGWDQHYGWGRLNIARALARIGAAPPTATSPPAPPTVTNAPAPPTAAPPTATTGPPPPATAQPPAPPPGSAALALDPAGVTPGGQATWIGAGFAPGELVGLRLLLADGTNRYLDATTADGAGAFRVTLAIPSDAPPGPTTALAQGVNSGRQASAPVLVGNGAPPPAAPPPTNPPATAAPQPPTPTIPAVAPIPVPPGQAFAAQPPQAEGPDVRYFAAVGHSLHQPFLAYWELYGGLPVFGYPISEPFIENDPLSGQPRIVQYFERNRFEYHAEYAGTPYAVLLGLLGRTVTAGRTFETVAPFDSTADRRYVPQTGHSLSGPFLRYWEAHGGLALFGYPISEPFPEVNPTDGQTYTVQYFERNRFEYHPQFAGTPNEVQLGLLGVQVARGRGLLP